MIMNINDIADLLSTEDRTWVNATRLQIADFHKMTEADFAVAKSIYFNEDFETSTFYIIVFDAVGENGNRYQLEISCRSESEQNFVTERWWTNGQLLGVHEVPCPELTDRHSYSYRAVTALLISMSRPEWLQEVKSTECEVYRNEDWNFDELTA